MLVIQHIKELGRLNPTGHIAVDMWTIANVDDVLENNEDRYQDINLSDKEKDQILIKFHNEQDANIGLNWEGLDDCVRDFVDNREDYLKEKDFPAYLKSLEETT